MSVERFLDTNIFIYQLEARDERKYAIAERIVRAGVETGNACISFQVVQECLNTVLRKAEVPLDTDGARLYLETVLAPLFRVPASIALYHRGLDIQARHRIAGREPADVFLVFWCQQDVLVVVPSSHRSSEIQHQEDVVLLAVSQQVADALRTEVLMRQNRADHGAHARLPAEIQRSQRLCIVSGQAPVGVVLLCETAVEAHIHDVDPDTP